MARRRPPRAPYTRPGAANTRFLFRLALLWLLSGTLVGLDPAMRASQYVYDHWGLEKGVPQLSVQAIEQTGDGYLWLGTQEGLVRFDGAVMTVFDKNERADMPFDYIRVLFEDSRGRLWIGAPIGLMHYEDQSFVSHLDDPQAPRSRIYAIAETPDGTIWIGAQTGLYRWRDGRFEEVDHNDATDLKAVYALAADGKGRLWIGAANGLFLMEEERFFQFTVDQGLAGNRIHSVCPAADGSLWIGAEGGLSHFDSGRFTNYTVEDGLASNTILSLLEDRDGVLWVGSNNGVARLHQGRVLPDPDYGAMAVKDEILAFEEDSEGSIWFGSWTTGLHRCREGLFTTLGQPEGLPGDVTRAVLEARDGALWIGSLSGLARLDGGEIAVFDKSNGLSDNSVYCLLQSRDGAIWVGTRFGGLNRIAEGRIDVYDTEQGLSDNTVRTLFEDSKGNLWIGSERHGLDLFQNDRFYNFSTENGLGSDLVSMIAEDRDGRIWVGSLGGGVTLIQDGELRVLTRADGLPGDSVYAFRQEPNGDIWLGSNGGLALYRDGVLSAARPEDGLYNGIAYTIVDDGRGRFWMSCNKGVHAVAKRGLYDFVEGRAAQVNGRAFGAVDGMRSPECNFGGGSSGLLGNDGLLRFPTVKGLVALDPDAAWIDPPAPPVYVESIVADGTRHEYTPFLQFGADLENLEIHYTAPYLAQSEKVRFRYRLEGMDTRWNEVSRRAAYYTNLAPGDYAFRVEARVDQGPWRRQDAPLHFRVEPLFHQTLWFRGIVAALTFGLALLALWAWNRASVARERKLQRLVEMKTRELQQMQEERARDAHRAGMTEIATNVLHNIGNALNSVNVTADIIEQDLHNLKVDFLSRVVALLEEQRDDLPVFFEKDERAQKILPALNKVSESLRHDKGDLVEKLSGLRDQVTRMNTIIRAQKSHIDKVGAFNETVDLNRMINEILEVQLANPDQTVNVIRAFQPLPRLKTQKSKLTQVLFYLIDNAFESLQMHADSKKIIRVVTKKIGGDMVLVELTDNGVGIESNRLESIFFDGHTSKPGAAGYGLHYCANAVREMRGRIRAFSRGKGQGATFMLELPLDPENAPSLFEISQGAASA